MLNASSSHFDPNRTPPASVSGQRVVKWPRYPLTATFDICNPALAAEDRTRVDQLKRRELIGDRHNMWDAKLPSYATHSAMTPRSPISISATPVSPIRGASRQN